MKRYESCKFFRTFCEKFNEIGIFKNFGLFVNLRNFAEMPCLKFSNLRMQWARGMKFFVQRQLSV